MLSDATDPTHVVVTKGTDANESEEAGPISIENRVVETAMDFGSAVHVDIERDVLEQLVDPAHRKQFKAVTDEKRRLSGSSEFQAPLPAGREEVRSLLSVDLDDTAQWHHRVFGLAELAVVTPDSWLYRSVPLHNHIREINADAADTYLAALRDALQSIPKTGLFPDGSLVTWTDHETEYELDPETLRQRTDGDRWHAFDLAKLQEVHPVPERRELLLRWQQPDSFWGRATAYARQAIGSPPPERVRVASGATVPAVVSTLEELADTLGYEFQVSTE